MKRLSVPILHLRPVRLGAGHLVKSLASVWWEKMAEPLALLAYLRISRKGLMVECVRKESLTPSSQIHPSDPFPQL